MSDAATNALNAIADICGCPDWDYPGQLVRDVAKLKQAHDEARRVARSVARMWMTFLLNGTLPDPAPDVDTALAYPDPEGGAQSQAASSATPA